MNIMHSSRSDCWNTPKEIIEMVKAVLGEIDFDPASSSHANLTVEAKEFYSSSSLSRHWIEGAVYLNPPGGKVGNKSQTGLFWERLMQHASEPLEHGFSHGIFMAFSIEALQNTQRKGCKAIVDFPICIPAKRIRFDGHIGKIAPSHSNAIVYVPGYLDKTKTFKEVFSQLGAVLNS